MTQLMCLTKSEALELELEGIELIITLNSRVLKIPSNWKFAFSLLSRYVSIEIRMQCTIFYKTEKTSKMEKFSGCCFHESLLLCLP